MNTNWRSMLTAASLGALVASSVMASGCVVRARARVAATAEPVYVVEEAPPPPREERVNARAGYVWVRGYWVFRGGEWQWKGGHWERARTGYDWQPGHWERRGNRYHWVEGRWVAAGTVRVHHETRTRPAPGPAVRDHRSQPEPAPGPAVRDHRSKPEPEPAPGPAVRDHRGQGHAKGHDHAPGQAKKDSGAHPAEPPPAPQAENVKPRKGYVWVPGHYEWQAGHGYRWVGGHWERARAKMVYKPGHWERQGKYYVWVEGQWVAE